MFQSHRRATTREPNEHKAEVSAPDSPLIEAQCPARDSYAIAEREAIQAVEAEETPPVGAAPSPAKRSDSRARPGQLHAQVETKDLSRNRPEWSGRRRTPWGTIVYSYSSPKDPAIELFGPPPLAEQDHQQPAGGPQETRGASTPDPCKSGNRNQHFDRNQPL